ncbi:hypothetical protein BB561_004899 [Smittium simulii]|uniref:Serine/threonine-protein phosphatase n=1 Tax=Smittium simulii TaxID=133385 RepID=A0A2T9YDI6_9FUNG|nr:hypothetical protein BB561_004899 [Smittium simulii]
MNLITKVFSSNNEFNHKKKKYKDAIEKYTLAIELDATVPAYYTNRAQCYLLTELFGAAIADAEEAIKLDANFVKAYYRRASAHMAMGNIEKAKNDYKIVVTKAPTDKVASEKFKLVSKLYKKMLFEEAITGYQDGRLLCETINPYDYIIDDTYNGPRMKQNPSSNSSESLPVNSLETSLAKNLPLSNDTKSDSESSQEILEYVDAEFVETLSTCFKDQKKLHIRYVIIMLVLLSRQFKKLDSLVDIDFTQPSNSSKVLNICGDVHGQYYDLLNIFKIAGTPTESNMFLFNGDFVDRGSFSVETVLLLFAYKLLYPNSFFLNRGNHETVSMNKLYGFEGELLAKYGKSSGEKLFKLFTETFNALPVAHLVNKSIFVVHGGLYSEDLGIPSSEDDNNQKVVTLDMIRNIDRFKQPGDSGILTESLWSDPQKLKGRSPNKRGVAIQFGPDVTRDFLSRNNLTMIVRSHEQKDSGYEIEHDGQLVTVFSAPNYCDTMGNLGAYMRVDSLLNIDYKTFKAVPHPPVKSMAYATNSPF